jgi:glutamine synthetase
MRSNHIVEFTLIVWHESGWDIHDAVYSRELLISNKKNGYRDIVARIDLSTFRRIPWEDNVPFFLVSFLDPETNKPLTVDPRGILKITTERAKESGLQCYAGVEYEVRLALSLGS